MSLTKSRIAYFAVAAAALCAGVGALALWAVRNPPKGEEQGAAEPTIARPDAPEQNPEGNGPAMPPKVAPTPAMDPPPDQLSPKNIGDQPHRLTIVANDNLVARGGYVLPPEKRGRVFSIVVRAKNREPLEGEGNLSVFDGERLVCRCPVLARSEPRGILCPTGVPEDVLEPRIVFEFEVSRAHVEKSVFSFWVAKVAGEKERFGLPQEGWAKYEFALKNFLPGPDQIAPIAAGVALVEVIEATPFGRDESPKGVSFKLRRVRGSGDFHDAIHVLTDPGPAARAASRAVDYLLSTPVKADYLKTGQRYWVAFAPPDYWGQTYGARALVDAFPQWVNGVWPENDPEAGPVLDEAVKADRWKLHPWWTGRFNIVRVSDTKSF